MLINQFVLKAFTLKHEVEKIIVQIVNMEKEVNVTK